MVFPFKSLTLLACVHFYAYKTYTFKFNQSVIKAIFPVRLLFIFQEKKHILYVNWKAHFKTEKH